ncbi:MAG TPA: proline iminopeptidase-family hydrolase [Gemmatimonadales bacterium]|nr:proline iminopeptidase-family hydrolase [Gemmatimonadales bacterium]
MRIVALLLVIAACGGGGGGSRGLTPGEGRVEVEGGRVWYRIVGSGARTPLVVLHGGPGVPSDYLKPLSALADERPVVFYDQLGAGRSDHPTDTRLWRVERFVDELARVRQALGVREVHLYGHSWGTMLAVDYMLTRPQGVRSLVLAGPAFSALRYKRDDDSLRATLPESVRSTLTRHERAGTCDAPEYQAAMGEYYRRFFARRLPWSADLDSTVTRIDPSSDRVMAGGCGKTTGPLMSYDRTARLREISVPALLAVGGYDPSTPAAARWYQTLLPGSELVVFDSSGHLPMHDEPERYVQVLRDFLRRVESR